jgi:hypothetical protein
MRGTLHLLAADDLALWLGEATGDAELAEALRGSWGSTLKPAAYRGRLCAGVQDEAQRLAAFLGVPLDLRWI